jgi:uncharacterized membrane protein
MVYFHIVYDMKEIFDYPVSYETGINSFTGSAAGSLFIFVSGISSTLSKSNVKRGLRLLGIALAITVATHLYNASFGIKFGILHFLGISMLLYKLYGKLNSYFLLVIGTLIIAAGCLIDGIHVSHDYFFPFGIYTESFVSSDYYPLIPWLGLFIYGVAVGKFLYSTKKRSIFSFSVPDNIISIAGRNTLLVYLVHQPVIYLLLTAVKYIFRR